MMNLDRNNQGKYIFGPLFIAVFIIFFSTYSTQISPQFSKSAHAAPQAAPQAGPLAAPQAAPQACGGLVQEGEAATLFGQFAVGNDGNASGGQYIHTPSGSGTNYNEADLANRAEFCVTVPSAGFYQIQGWIYADSGGHNSFYVMVDGQPSDGYIWHTAQNTSYNSDLVSDPDAGDPVEVALTSGDHLITFVKREEQTRLDKMELVLIQSFEEGEGAVINEFMASNSNTLNDEDGDSSDWIELRNPSPLVVNMDGWYLTDDPTDLTKWTFPSTQIAGNDYFIVFASNKNRAQPGAELHTNFKLSSGGDYLALVKPDGVTIVSEFAPTYPEQYSDISFGPDANDSLVYFSPATPGAVNGSGVQIAFLAPPTANVQRGFYTSAQSIALTTSPGTTIRYTTDATDPTSSHGTVYSGPITVDQTTTLRFMAYDGNGNESTIDTHTYIFVADVLTQPTMYQSVINQYADQVDDALLDIPTISLVTPHEIPGHRENEIIPVQTSVELIFPDGKPGFQVGAGVKKYGWASLNRPKNNMRLSFDQEYGVSNLRWPLFADWGQGTLTPAEEFDTIDLRAGGHGDQFLGGTSTSTATQNVTYIARRFIADTRLDMGGLNPHGFFVHVYINGVYWGQYNMGERVDADFYAEYGTGDDADYEAVKSTNTQDGNTWSVADGTGAMWQDIVDNRSNYDYVKDRLDVADHIDYWLTKTFVWFENEYRAAGPVDAATPGGYVIDSNDTDGAFAPVVKWNLWGTPLNDDRTGWGSVHNIYIDLWNSGNTDFRTLVYDRIANAYFAHNDLSGALEATTARARFDEWRGYIALSILTEAARWVNDATLPDKWLTFMNDRSTFVEQRSHVVLQQLKNRGYFPLNPVTLVADLEATSVRYIRLMKSGHNPGGNALNLGEVEVIDVNGINRALIGTATQNAEFDVTRFPAGRCNDGNLTPATGANLNLCHTQGGTANDWWEVDLGAVYDIREIRITNRTDCCTDRLGNVFVLAADTAFASTGTDLAAARANADFESQINNSVTAANPARTIIIPNTTSPESWGVSQIIINNPNGGQIYYTTDGTDPRLSGGATSPSAILYSGPINLTQSSIVKARPLADGIWGPITADTYHVNPQASAENLLITEIHYNGDGHDPNPFNASPLNYSSDEYEFLEFKNIGAERIDLTGVSISQGVTFTFELMPEPLTIGPGEHVVVVENKAAFASRYQDAASAYYHANIVVAGQWTGALNNDGELLTVLDRDGVEILNFAYNDSGRWPGRADGNGSTLEIDNLAAVPSNPATRNSYLADGDHWQPSSEYHGSPGRDGLGPDNRIVVNEVLANSTEPLSDTIEFLNTTDSTIDIAGWFVSDTSNEDNGGFRKYTFPAGTTMDAGAYLVIDENHFNNAANPDNLVPFALSSTTGDDVYLMEADAAGNLLRFVDRVEFGATANDESIGLWPDGSVEGVQSGDLYPMLGHTFGAANNSNGNGVRVGSVVISEIHYNPFDLDQNFEFIEITNNGSVTETLVNWRLRGEVDFDFIGNYSGTTLAPEETLVFVRFDPTNQTQMDTFRNAYDLPEEIQVVGPWTDDGVTGKRLGNGGGTLKIQRPDALVTPTNGDPPFYPMLLEDQVQYDDDAPWVTEPDGNGPSLGRIDLAVYGDDPTNWEASDPPLLSCIDIQPITDLSIGRVGFDMARLFWSAPQDGSEVEIWRSEQPYFTPGDADSTLLHTATDTLTSYDDTTAALGDIAINHFYALRTVEQCGNTALSSRVGEFEYALTETGSSDFNWVGLPLMVDGITLGNGDNASLVNHIINNTSNNGSAVTPTIDAIEEWNNVSQSFNSYLPELPFLGGINVRIGGVYRVSADLPGEPVQNAIWTLLGTVPDASQFTQSLAATGTTNYNWVMVPLGASALSDSALLIDDVEANSTPTVEIVSLDKWNGASQSFDSFLPDFPFLSFGTQAGHAYRLSLVDEVVPGTAADWR